MAETIGLLYPGEMGATVGAAAQFNAGNAVRVLWTSEGRSPETRQRAQDAKLTDVGSLSSLVAQSDIVLSVCPPHTAITVAQSVAALQFRGTYVDANAVSPVTSKHVQQIVERAGATFVDGGIIGPPALTRGTTRLYVAGDAAARVAACFEHGSLETLVLDHPPGAASALKMTYAAYTKGTAALLIAIRSLAIHEGVDPALLQEWRLSQPDLPKRSEGAVRANARKAWRFSGEMEEIANTFAAAGLPDGFHRAAADVYQRLAEYKDAPIPPSIEEAASSPLKYVKTVK